MNLCVSHLCVSVSAVAVGVADLGRGIYSWANVYLNGGCFI